MKKKYIIILLFLLGLGVGGFFYWDFISSPKYSLYKIKESIDNHDITTFEKHVDIDGIVIRLFGEIPEIVGGKKEIGLFGEEISQMLSQMLKGFMQESFVKIAKESVKSFVERGYFDDKMTQKGSISKIFKKIKIDNFKTATLKEIHREGKICKIFLQIYSEAYEDNINIRFMMRDKGYYWQFAEISNVKEIIKRVEMLAIEKRFIDKKNGIVIDNKTDLMWQKTDDGVMRNWEDAMSYAKNLNFAGYSDWSLPTKDELKSLVYCSNGKSTPLDDRTSCGDDYTRPTIDSVFNCKSSWYWSSSTYANYTDNAWDVCFGNGHTNSGNKSNSNYVRCVSTRP